MKFALAALALLPASALATIVISGPSATSFWVQNTSNVITWTYASGDPSPVDILISNPDNTTLNGNFTIARFVDVSAEAVTITHVTLKTGTGYQASFVNPTNYSQVYATSNGFDVKVPGTPPAPTSSAPSPSSSSSGSSAAVSANSTSTSPSSGTSSSITPTAVHNAAPRAFGSVDVRSMIAACGMAGLAAMLL